MGIARGEYRTASACPCCGPGSTRHDEQVGEATQYPPMFAVPTLSADAFVGCFPTAMHMIQYLSTVQYWCWYVYSVITAWYSIVYTMASRDIFNSAATRRGAGRCGLGLAD